ncbi:TPA: GNAT family N-acetyltransferase [Pseudomonas aeruginosa]|nr:GNAT family N-acetyltransferase [Pseudomonas aeruginosa]HBN8505580.1 GNAT family N-acetyltransferase [Pseudomonas aeruginosa]HBO4210248.1 GNAT family N-acetyltransferase [Pseudomonas aeruginosa]HCE5991813.1 GNAT family N-acetyltransferase [Pseudomonas aeruginosa]HCF9583755.1 GNAT family N-acetyltransferase [Pseudomonas aeruginosa]
MRSDLHEANRLSWNAATRAHNSHKADQAAFFRNGGSTLYPEELQLLGHLDGLRLLHLQCNAGQDSLSLARLGARVTGVDIADSAIDFARQLSRDSGIAADFQRDDILRWLPVAATRGERFERVFASYGTLVWLSDLKRWADGIAQVLVPGGRFVLVEFHPFALYFDPHWQPAYDYFSREPIAESGVSDYVAESGALRLPRRRRELQQPSSQLRVPVGPGRCDRRPARRRPATRTAGGIPLRQRLGRLRRHARRRRRTHAAARRSSAPAADVRPQRKETTMTEERLLRRDEIPLVWEIDRSEVIEHLYSVEAGQLVLRPEFYDMRGWPEGEAEHYTPILLDCFDRGGWFLGLFDQGHLIGAVVLDPRRLGPERDWLQLKFLHLSHAYRRRGLGAHLFHLAATQARHLGASALYVSATPSQNTVDFYMRLGCRLCMEPDEELYRLEPEDVHLVYQILNA